MRGFDVLLWLIAIALALGAGWLTIPRAPTLDWERLFKLALLTRLRGQIEATGEGAERWLSEGRKRVWYHPAGRDAAQKVMDPQRYTIPVPALAGERALMDQLRTHTTAAARLAAMYGSGADEPLYEDPAELGEAWSLSALLGQGADWDALAALSAPLIEALRRRNDRRRWVVVADEGAAPRALVGELEALLGPDRARFVGATDPEELARGLDACVPELADRLVIVAVGEAVPRTLEVLRAELGLRDRLVAFVALSAALGPSADWMATQFTHEGMDTELNRRTAYLSLAFVAPDVDPPGEPGLPAVDARILAPPTPESGRVVIEAIDLGLLPGSLETYPPELLAAGLLVTVSGWLALAG